MRAVIPYTTDAHANAATKNPQLKLMFRLVHCHVRDEGERASFFCAAEMEWKPGCIIYIAIAMGRVVFFSHPPSATQRTSLLPRSPSPAVTASVTFFFID